MPAPFPPASTGLLSTGQVARMLGCTKNTILNWISRGKVACVIYPDAHTHARIAIDEARRLVEQKRANR